MRFQLVDRAKKDFPVHRLCRVLGVSQSGYFAWKDRPASRRQRDDMVMLAHVRSAFALSRPIVLCTLTKHASGPGSEPFAVCADESLPDSAMPRTDNIKANGRSRRTRI